jgi:hypothetical protein
LGLYCLALANIQFGKGQVVIVKMVRVKKDATVVVTENVMDVKVAKVDVLGTNLNKLTKENLALVRGFLLIFI